MRNNRQNEIILIIGRAIESRRLELKMSRTLLANEIGVDEKQVRRIEKGEVNATILSLLKICFVLKLEPSFLNNIELTNEILNY